MLKLRLQLFAEGAAGAGAGTASAAAPSAEGIPGAEGEAAVPKRSRKENPLAAVKYGKQPEVSATNAQSDSSKQQTDPADTATANNADMAEESFDELINGKYKKDFDDRVQNIVKQRLKNSKGTEETFNKLMPAVMMLSERYGLDTSNMDKFDVDRFVKAVTEDNAMYEDEALKEGVPVETYKKLKNLERNEKIRQVQDTQRAADDANRSRIIQLISQGEQLKQSYPNFNLDAEMKNTEFRRLVSSNVPVKTAYEVLHKDEIMSGAMQYTANIAAQKVANAIASGAKRPPENGVSSQSAAVIKDDPKKLTKADRDEIKRRVRNGEKIIF